MVWASTGPMTRTMRTTLLTELAVTLPLTSETCTSPSTELTWSGPWHERMTTSPRTDCALTEERIPVTEISLSIPDSSSGSQTGTVSRHSTSAGDGWRELTPSLSTPFPSSVTSLSVRSCSAWTRTSLRSHAVTSMSPDRFDSMSVTPGPTRSTVSVVTGSRRARARAASTHSSASSGISGPSRNTSACPEIDVPEGNWPDSIACWARTISAWRVIWRARSRAARTACSARSPVCACAGTGASNTAASEHSRSACFM